MSDPILTICETSTVTITFSEPVIGFNNADVIVQNGTLSTLISQDSGITWTGIFTPNENINSLSNIIIVASSYSDLVGNSGSVGISSNYTINTVSSTPTISSIIMSDTALNIGSTSTVTITFSEAVMGFSNSDVTVQNGTLSTLTSVDGGITWTGTFRPYANIDSATNVITVGDDYTNLCGVPGCGATSSNYIIDTIAPTVSSIIMSDTHLNVGASSNIIITFSEVVTGFNNSDVSSENGTLSLLTTLDNITWTGTFTPNPYVEDPSNIIIISSNYTDLAGNMGSSATSYNYSIDTQAPFVTCLYMSDPYLTIGDTSVIGICFSEPVIEFSNSNVSVENGTLTTLRSHDGGTFWTGVFIPCHYVNDSSNLIIIDPGYTDLLGNVGSGFIFGNYIVNTIPDC